MRHLFALLPLLLFGCATFSKPFECKIPESPIADRKEYYTILAFGDFGQDDKPGKPNYLVGAAMAKVCNERGCDFALGLGDNFYPGGVSGPNDKQFITKFENPYKDLHIPFYMTLGNHDYMKNPGAQIEYKSERWKMACAYYPVPKLPEWLAIFAFDTNKMDETQVAQARDVFCSKTGWKIAIGHHPLYSNGEHGDEAVMKEKVLPLLKACKAQVVLSGHDHDLEHISSPDVEQIVSGAAGKLRDIPTGVIRDGLIQRFAASQYGFAVLKVSRENLVVDFYNDQAQVIYHFERTK